jgi:hypothetical protein
MAALVNLDWQIIRLCCDIYRKKSRIIRKFSHGAHGEHGEKKEGEINSPSRDLVLK